MKYMHGAKWVLIKLVDTCFIGEFQLNQIDACSNWFSSVEGLTKGIIFREPVRNSLVEKHGDQPHFNCYFNFLYFLHNFLNSLLSLLLLLTFITCR